MHTHAHNQRTQTNQLMSVAKQRILFRVGDRPKRSKKKKVYIDVEEKNTEMKKKMCSSVTIAWL